MQQDLLDSYFYDIQKEYNKYKIQEVDLLYNISFLKQKGVVVMASEYSKSKTDLSSVQKLLTKIEIQMKNQQLKINRQKKKIDDIMKEYNKATKESEKKSTIVSLEKYRNEK